MSYKIELTDNFKKEAKILRKKYPSLKSDLEELGNILMDNPQTGTHVGNNVYKIRLKITSKGKGKRGGARIMSFVKVINEIIYLFSIYNKGDKDDISDDEIKELLREIPD